MRNLLICILTLVTLDLATSAIFAQCSCEPELSLKEYFARSEAVMIGKVVEANKFYNDKTQNMDIVIKFEVKTAWKRDMERFLVVKELYGSLEGFEQNSEWLLYVLKDKNGDLLIERGCCSRTKRLSVALKQGDLKAFKKMAEKPKRIN